MNTKDVANILYNMALDMDYDEDYFEEELTILEKEISAIKDSPLYYVLETIADQNDDVKNCIAKENE